MSDVAIATLRWVHSQDGIDGVVRYVDMLLDTAAHDASIGLAWSTLLPAVDDLLDACDEHLTALAPRERRTPHANRLAAAAAAARLPARHAHQIGDTP